jgi:hypothetical protein
VCHVLQVVWNARAVAATTRHQEIETHFRALVAEADLPPPDDVSYEPESIIFYWHAPKLAVVVDFEDVGAC